MNDEDTYLFKIEFCEKDEIYDQKECYIFSDSYDQAERIALKKNKNAQILNISKIATTPSSLFFDENYWS
jgi:hypothetical protein